MNKTGFETNLVRIISWSSLLATVVVSAWWSTEPVNYSKLLVISIAACALLLSTIIPTFRTLYSNHRLLIGSLLAFLLMATLSTALSSDELAQNFYGVHGRSTGFLAYFSLVLLMTSSVLVTKIESFNKVIRFFFIAGIVNVTYVFSEILGFDFIPWKNVFGVPLGTLGNPNFIGALLGFLAVGLFATSLNSSSANRTRILSLILLFVALFEIDKTNALQGFIVAAIGFMYIALLYIRSRTPSRFIQVGYIFLTACAGALSLLGMLQVGPLKDLLYKSSISLRGIYWNAGIKTGLSNFWTGAGMDSYGSWFRRSRDISKLGPDTWTNAAHNVVIDIFASGGIFMLLSYLAFTLLIGVRILQFVIKYREFDATFAILSGVWICYQLQSLISINQIGLAIWGWVFGGLIVAYTSNGTFSRELAATTKTQLLKKKKHEPELVDTKIMLSSILGAIVGLSLAMPPFLADANWRLAMISKDEKKIEQALKQWPTDPVRLSSGMQLYINNKMYEKAYEIAKVSTQNFPNDYYSWYNYGYMPNISVTEKSEIEKQLKRLDPNNPKRPW
jgi:O-antigen ligase